MSNIYIDREELKGKSQPDMVLWFLEKYGRISNLQCHEFFGIRHAPSVIRALRKRFENTDYAIINEHKKGKDRFGNNTKWDDYVLIQDGRQGKLNLEISNA